MKNIDSKVINVEAEIEGIDTRNYDEYYNKFVSSIEEIPKSDPRIKKTIKKQNIVQFHTIKSLSSSI